MGRIHEFSMPGAHSDIGGSYSTRGISAVTLRMAMSFLRRVGVPLQEPNQEFQPDPTVFGPSDFAIHDSRFSWDPRTLKTPFSEALKHPRPCFVAADAVPSRSTMTSVSPRTCGRLAKVGRPDEMLLGLQVRYALEALDQGRYGDAKSIARSVLQEAPGHAAAQQALQRAHEAELKALRGTTLQE
jgi:hypothetical protein